MSQNSQGPRPGQATFAGWLIIGGSIILVITAWQRISGLNTLETQEAMRTALAEPPLSGTGMTLASLTTLIRVASMVAAAAATASAILGFHALRRSTSARLALTMLAPLVLVGGFATEAFFAPLVVAGVVMLWLTPTRDWFAGRPWVNRMVPPDVDPTRPDPFARQDHDDAADRGDSPDPPTAPTVPPQGSWPAPSPYGVAQPAPRGPRPNAVRWACGLTWAMSGLVALMMTATAAVVALASDQFLDELERQQPGLDLQGLSETEFVAGVVAVAILAVLWSVAAIVLAIFTFRGHNWARIALVVSSAVTAVVCLLAMIANPALGVVVAAAAVTAGLLLRPNVAAWYRR